MLVIRIEYWPHGNRSEKQLIGTGVIVNDVSSESLFVGNYNAWFAGLYDDDPHEIVNECPPDARVEGFRRLENDSWTLLGIALSSRKHGLTEE